MHNTMMQCFAERDNYAQELEIKCHAMDELQDDITVRELISSSCDKLFKAFSHSACVQVLSVWYVVCFQGLI